MKTCKDTFQERQLRPAGPGVIALLGRADGRAVTAMRRRLERLRRHADDLFPKSPGPRHD